MMRRLLTIGAALLAGGALANPFVTQTIELATGENWVYVEVTPVDNACSAVFADTSVTSAQCYDPRAYENTAQYDSDGNLIHQKPVSFLIWHKAAPAASTLRNMIGGQVYKMNAASACTLNLTGRPQLPRLYWRQTTTATNGLDILNMVAPSLPSEATDVTVAAYFGEGPSGSAPYVVERSEGKVIEHPVNGPRVVLRPGQAYYLSATHAEEWPGVIGISGAANGLTFTSNGSSQVSFILQNRGTTNHVFRLSYGPGQDSAVPPTLLYLDSGDWTNLTSGAFRDIVIAPKAQTVVTLGVSPAQRQAGAGLLTVSDLGATKMRVRLPVVVEAAAASAENARWPDGLYLGTFALNRVNNGKGSKPTLAGGAVEGTLIYLSTGNGTKGCLLQRLCLGVDTNGATFYGLDLAKVRAGAKADTTVRRISSVVLDPYNPKIAGNVSDGTGTFSWKVDKHAATNPMRHSWHPDHDGLRAMPDGSVTLAPDGDDMNNYMESVKPELFSIDNVVTLTGLPVSSDQTRAVDETVSGTITWTLKNLRSEASGGDITCTGTYSLSRISATTVVGD